MATDFEISMGQVETLAQSFKSDAEQMQSDMQSKVDTVYEGKVYPIATMFVGLADRAAEAIRVLSEAVEKYAAASQKVGDELARVAAAYRHLEEEGKVS